MTCNPAVPRQTTASVFWPALLVVSGALALRLYFFVGVLGSDDVFHALGAMQLLDEGWFVPVGHHAARIGLWLPTVPLLAWFGGGEWQVALYPMLCSLLVVVLAIAIGWQLFDRSVALIAGLLAAVFPLDVFYGSTLYPDVPLGAFTALALFLAIQAARSDRPALLAMLSGLAWGYAYLVKMEAAFLLPAVVALWPLGYLSFRNLVIISLGVGAVVFAENLIYYLATGQILYRVHNITTGVTYNPAFAASGLWEFPKTWFLTPYQFGLHYYLLFAGMILAVAKARRPALLATVWAAFYLLWLQFGGNPLADSYTIKSHLARYCSMLSVPASLLGGYFVVAGLGALRRWLVPVTLAGTVAVSLFMANFNQLSQEAEFAIKRGLRQVRDQAWYPLYADSTTATAALLLWWRHPAPPVGDVEQALDRRTATPTVSGAHMMLSLARLAYRHQRYFEPMPDLDWFTRCADLELRIDNPMPGLAYDQTRLMRAAAGLIPGLGPSVQRTADDLLRDRDVVVYWLPSPPRPGCGAAG